MNGEIESIKEESPERKLLRDLESQNKFLFHGTAHRLESLEPRQAYNHPPEKDNVKIPDGEPAVFAASNTDMAIFMSIINEENAKNGFKAGYNSSSNSVEEKAPIHFYTNEFTMNQIKNANGYIYVFDKDKFKLREGRAYEWIATEPVIPIQVIEVKEKDLPGNIEIKDY